MDEKQREHSAHLMHIDHSVVEVRVQTFYQGQALTARDQDTHDSMQRSASEETNHLAWSERRLKELDGPLKLLKPLWCAGSFFLAAAGAIGDKWSLGFVAETERQVVAHLQSTGTKSPWKTSAAAPSWRR